MGERLRPLSSSWMAPYSLAAQLTAQAGQAAGAGYASIGQSIGQGIAAGASRREQRREFDVQTRLRENEFAFRQSQAAKDEELRRGQLARQDAMDSAQILKTSLMANSARLESMIQGGMDPQDPALMELNLKNDQLLQSLTSIASGFHGDAVKGVFVGQDLGDLPKPPPIPEPLMIPGLNAPGVGQATEATQAPDSVEALTSLLRASEENLARISSRRVSGERATVARERELARERSTIQSLGARLAAAKGSDMERRAAAEGAATASAKARESNRKRTAEGQDVVGRIDATDPSALTEADREWALRGDTETIGFLKAKAENLKDAREQRQAMERQRNSADLKIRVAKFRAELPPKPETMSPKEYASMRLSALSKTVQALRGKLDPFSGVPLTPQERTDAASDYNAALEALNEEVSSVMALPRDQAPEVSAPAQPSDDMKAKEQAALSEYNALPPDQRTPEKIREIAAKHGVRSAR